VRGPGQEAKHNSCEAARAANKIKLKHLTDKLTSNEYEVVSKLLKKFLYAFIFLYKFHIHFKFTLLTKLAKSRQTV